MSPAFIQDQLRQQQILQQMQQTTGQGVNAALLQSNPIRQFGDPDAPVGGVQQTTQAKPKTGTGGALDTAVSKIPGMAQLSRASQAVRDKVQGITQPLPPVPSTTVVGPPSPGTPVTNTPGVNQQLMRRQLIVDPSGNLTIGSDQLPPIPQMQQQLPNFGQYNPNIQQ